MDRPESSKFIQSGFRTIAPVGWRNFIAGNEDLKTKSPKGQIKLDRDHLYKIAQFNKRVNKNINYVSDEKNDLWQVAETKGDCEDIVLRKLHDLTVMLNYPRSLFSIATCWTETKLNHAVLVLHTDEGDMILDSRFDHVAAWHRLPYRWGAIEQHRGIDDFWHMIIKSSL
ncbi:transglutaminase-like cysteine peptidase [Kiloniella spongiae]|uniref:transglutaminase-like cysteine peptidase n=1 Tax=Kiloniella spongiae TaxID=1489064 RepID=UPI00138DE014|nr:transglutaminase-like cysteine peptidase [Kiloniella spongiae]